MLWKILQKKGNNFQFKPLQVLYLTLPPSTMYPTTQVSLKPSQNPDQDWQNQMPKPNKKTRRAQILKRVLVTLNYNYRFTEIFVFVYISASGSLIVLSKVFFFYSNDYFIWIISFFGKFNRNLISHATSISLMASVETRIRNVKQDKNFWE